MTQADLHILSTQPYYDWDSITGRDCSMCGIAGWVDWADDLRQVGNVLDRMVATLAPRGPDASGRFLTAHAALGHRRLVVVDPAGGAQPMTRQKDGCTCTIVYNGELYNTEDIRRDLLACGHSFRGHSDTEVLLASYLEWGPDCLARLNGIFAFAVWTEEGGEESLFLARDRMGVKPLFYTQRGSAFLFASELKALLAHPAVPAEVDAEGLAEVFGLGPARTPGHGVFRGVAELRPGCCLRLSPAGLQVAPYWRLESRPHPDDFPTTIQKVHDLLADAIERQLVSDVPICTFLSGGLDSSVISAFAAAAHQRGGLGRLRTFSVDYVDNDLYFQPSDFQPNADAPWIKRMVEYLDTSHRNVVIDTPQLAAALIDATLARDLPGMADVDSSLLLFCRQIKQQATVALSGECADEVFGGYPWFHRRELLAARTFPWSTATTERANLLAPALRKQVRLTEYVDQRYRDTLAEVPRLPGEPAEDARRREMFYLNMVWFMQTLLDRKDRMSMATGLEVRVPFCDHRIVEYVWNIPWETKMCDGREKGIVRRAMRGVLPDDVIERRKSPYPKTHNPTYTRAMQSWLREILADPATPLRDLLDMERVGQIVATGGAAFQRPWYGQLMTGPQLLAYLGQVDVWLRRYRVRVVL